MATPDELISQAANELRSDGHSAAAAYVEANGPEDNPSLWEGNDSQAIVAQLVDTHAEEYRSEIEDLVASLVERIRSGGAASEDSEGGAADGAEDADRFGWITADQRSQLEAAMGPSWPDQLGDRLVELWGAGWESEYEDADKTTALNELIPLFAMPFSGLTDEEFEAYLNEVNTDLWNEMLDDELMQEFEAAAPGITAEIYHVLSEDLTQIAREGWAEHGGA